MGRGPIASTSRLRAPPMLRAASRIISIGGAALAALSIGCATKPDAPLPSPSVSASSMRVPGIQEPSGVLRAGNRLLIVGDDEHGALFELPLSANEMQGASRIALDPTRSVAFPSRRGSWRSISKVSPCSRTDARSFSPKRAARFSTKRDWSRRTIIPSPSSRDAGSRALPCAVSRTTFRASR